MKKKYEIILHILYWLFYYAWGEISLTLFAQAHHFNVAKFFDPLWLAEYTVFMGTFYINYFFIMPRYFKKDKILQAWIGWILLVVFFVCLRYVLEEQLLYYWFKTSNYNRGVGIIYYAFDNSYYGINNIMMSIVIWGIVNWASLKRQLGAAMKEKKAAELSFLRQQVNPHFLFNTLNNIYSLVYHSSEKALPAILKLSELMRYMTKESSADKIELSKEIAYIKSFVELESLRVVGTASVELTIEGETDGVMIEPLLLIPFIENGFKHGVVSNAAHPFVITITVKRGELLLYTKNKINQHQKDTSSGIGLENVRKRLALLYPDKHTLHVKQDGEYYICNLTIKL